MKVIFKKTVVLLAAVLAFSMLMPSVQVHAKEITGTYQLAMQPPVGGETIPVVQEIVTADNQGMLNTPAKLPFEVLGGGWLLEFTHNTPTTKTFITGETYAVLFAIKTKSNDDTLSKNDITIYVNGIEAERYDYSSDKSYYSCVMKACAPLKKKVTEPEETPEQVKARLVAEEVAKNSSALTSIGAAVQNAVKEGKIATVDVSELKGYTWVPGSVWKSAANAAETMTTSLKVVYTYKGQKKTFEIPAGTVLSQLKDSTGNFGGFEFIAGTLGITPEIVK